MRQVELTPKGRTLITQGFGEPRRSYGRCGRHIFKKRTADIAAALEKIGQARSKVLAVGLSFKKRNVSSPAFRADYKLLLLAHEGDQTDAAGDLKFLEDGMEMLLDHGHA